MNIFNQQNEIAEIVDKILTLKKANPQADTSRLEREIDRLVYQLEREIDRLVYQLYELTDDEIRIVEGKEKL
jgi:regulator of sirC expression with transglutaminase-like and TPR domain